MVIRELSDFGEFLVGFVEKRPVDFANWDARILLHLHCQFQLGLGLGLV